VSSSGRRGPGGRSLARGASPARRVRHGGPQVSEVQRARMLNSAVQVVAEYGYGRMSVSRVISGARVSRRTFYDVFSGREDCFLAVFEDALARVEGIVMRAYEADGGGWREKTRAGLSALLGFLDEEPGMRALLIVDVLRAGPRVLERRAQVLERLGAAIGEDCSRSQQLPALTGEGVVGAVFGVIHARVSAKDSGGMLALLPALMGVIVLPYEGPAAARKELQRPIPRISPASKDSRGGTLSVGSPDPLDGLDMRLTYRTLRVLTVIGDQGMRGSGLSNREVADGAGIADQGQISKLLTRLEGLGLIENMRPARHRRDQPTGEPNAWRLAPRGQEVQQATRVDSADDQESEAM
jgi:AcrR family transcriptional regulator